MYPTNYIWYYNPPFSYLGSHPRNKAPASLPLPSQMAEFQGTNWDSLISNYQSNFNDHDKREMEVIAISNSLRTLLERKSNNSWHQKYFNKYLEEGINPMGLRIQIFPTIHIISLTLKKKWEENLQACSDMMTALLVDDYKEQMISLDQEIEKLYATNSKNIEKGQLKDIEKEIKEHLITFNQEIINKKRD